MNQFLWGALATAALVSSLLFAKFFNQTRERLFALFSAGFFVLSLNWLILGLTQPGDESRHYAFYIRLVAFGLLLYGIIDKNRRPN
jgi:hypothetical protein